MYSEGKNHIKMGSIVEAQRISNELKDLIEKGLNKKAMRYFHALEGAIELENKNYARAIEHFNKTISLLPFQSSIYDEHALFMEPLALAYYRSGDLEKAQEEYDRITTLTTGRFLNGDIYAKSFYMLGKIYEQLGDTTKAIEHYEKFLDIWKDADLGLPEVDDARKRLAGLKGE
jgi:tetratricopeptide (TPR) repeat protein